MIVTAENLAAARADLGAFKPYWRESMQYAGIENPDELRALLGDDADSGSFAAGIAVGALLMRRWAGGE